MNIQSQNNSAGYISSPEHSWRKNKQVMDDEFEPQDKQMLDETNSKFQSQCLIEDPPMQNESVLSQNSFHYDELQQMMQAEILSPSKLLRTGNEPKSTLSFDIKLEQTSIQEEPIVNQRTRRKASKANYNVDDSPTMDSEIKPCHCSKTNCLQLYCSCFHNRRQCTQECKCSECFNDGQHSDEVLKAIEQIKIKEQRASHHDLDSFDTRQVWGCKCKNLVHQRILRMFYQTQKCSSHCQCSNCQNKNKNINKQENQKYDQLSIQLIFS